ncbi:MAG: helix-turn-helix domain-containing protein [Saprospiraceae bacterium]
MGTPETLHREKSVQPVRFREHGLCSGYGRGVLNNDPAKFVSEVAYELGFQHPQHFSRYFKQRVNIAPNKYRGTPTQ